MPQMSPMKWSLLLILTFIFMILLLINIYTNPFNFNSINKKFKSNLKWKSIW